MWKLPLFLIIIVLFLNISCSTTPAKIPTSTTTLTASPTLIPTPIAVTVSPLPSYGFRIGNVPFQFLGANVNMHFFDKGIGMKWSEAADIDLIKSAKNNGITVFDLVPPYFENSLGNYQENELIKLDHLLDTASQNGIYVYIPFINATGIALNDSDPYYNPGGIEGLVKDERLKEAYKKLVAKLVTRVNTVNHKKYNEDPTTLAWSLCTEILSGPQNYPKGPPNITMEELATWVEGMASYVKSLDANHLVTLNTHSGLAKYGENWESVLNVPSLDFVEVEDAEARFLYITDSPVDFYLKVFELKKPVVMMISFTGGALDQGKIAKDYTWQAEKLREIFKVYYEMGVTTGFTIYNFASELNKNYILAGDPYAYTSSNTLICQAFVDIASTLGPRNSTIVPLEFVKISSK